MDAFPHTLFSAAVAWTGLAIPIGSRQYPVLRHCIEDDDPPVLLTYCTGPKTPVGGGGGYLLLLTRRRLVVTQRTGFLRHRVRLHLNAELRHLGAVTWHADDRRWVVELAVTAIDGVRERFLIRTTGPDPLWRIDDLLRRVFRPTTTASADPALEPWTEHTPALAWTGRAPARARAEHQPSPAAIRMARPARHVAAVAG